MLDVLCQIPWGSEGLRVHFGEKLCCKGAEVPRPAPGRSAGPKRAKPQREQAAHGRLTWQQVGKGVYNTFLPWNFKTPLSYTGCSSQSRSSQIHPSVSPAVNQ